MIQGGGIGEEVDQAQLSGKSRSLEQEHLMNARDEREYVQAKQSKAKQIDNEIMIMISRGSRSSSNTGKCHCCCI
jgi:hypothetical protein